MLTQAPAPIPAVQTIPHVRIEGLNKWFGALHVLKDVDLSVRPGSRIVVCGPSGSGKSTLIRCINGLEPFQKGTIQLDGIALGLSLIHI